MAVPPGSPNQPQVTVPKLVRDPVQSLRPWPVVATLGGEDFTIPALPAADWLAVLMVPEIDLDEIFPGLLSEEDAEAVEDILFEELDLDEFQQVALDVVEVASGRAWWVALRLVGLAQGSWDLLGAEMILRGVDADRISLSAWLDALLILALRNMEPKDATMFTLKLETPPASELEKAAEPEMSRDAFMSMM